MLKRAATSLWNKSRRLFPCNSRLGACLNRGGVGETGLSCQALSDWREGPPLAAPFQQSRPQLSAPSSQPSFWGVTEPHRLHSVLGAFIWSPVSWRLTPEKEAWRGERCGPWSVHSLSKHASNLILHLAPCWPAGVGDRSLRPSPLLGQRVFRLVTFREGELGEVQLTSVVLLMGSSPISGLRNYTICLSYWAFINFVVKKI